MVTGNPDHKRVDPFNPLFKFDVRLFQRCDPVLVCRGSGRHRCFWLLFDHSDFCGRFLLCFLGGWSFT